MVGVLGRSALSLCVSGLIFVSFLVRVSSCRLLGTRTCTKNMCRNRHTLAARSPCWLNHLAIKASHCFVIVSTASRRYVISGCLYSHSAPQWSLSLQRLLHRASGRVSDHTQRENWNLKSSQESRADRQTGAAAARAFDVRHARRNVHVDAWTQVEMATGPNFGLERTASASPSQR
jgi:hypothetical protein